MTDLMKLDADDLRNQIGIIEVAIDTCPVRMVALEAQVGRLRLLLEVADMEVSE